MNTGSLSGNSRSIYWDNIKGFLILLVVFAHILYQLQGLSGGIDATVDYIYMFHMPAFVFVSGYFGKGEKAGSFEKIIKLVFLYFIFNSITLFIKYPEGYTSLVEPLYSYWYLIALIVWRLTAHRIARFRFIYVVLFAAALVAGFFSSIDNHFAVARIIGFYPFYMAGYLLSEDKNSGLVGRKYSERSLIGVITLLCAALLAFVSREQLGLSGGALKMEAYPEPKDLLGRIALFAIAFLAIYTLRCFSPDKKIPLITLFGRNSLWIFLFHRLITLWISERIVLCPEPWIIVISVLSAFVLCIAMGNDAVADVMNRFLSSGTDIFLKNDKKISAAKVVSFCVALGLVFIAVFNAVTALKAQSAGIPESAEKVETDVIYPVMTDQMKKEFDDSFRITFAGDLILLEDQVNLGYTGNGYDFSDVFEYAKPYISSADLAIGVFEGPMAGADKGYSTGNFRDGKCLSLNFPDEYASAVKDAGFDLVTTANNHLLDKGEDGALRTIDVLDRTGLDHTGSYKSPEDKANNHIKLVETEGIRIAVLSYTYGSNYISNEDLDGKYSYLTSVISGTEGERFEKLKASVEADFEEARALSPDLIMVLPHIGTQFLNTPDKEQEVWFEIFKENGADIILGDHPHVVEPVVIEEYKGKTVFTAYCPGNFANIFRDEQGDTSMLIDIYIDRNTKQVAGGSIVPLYTYAPVGGNYRAVPVYDIMNDAELREHLTYDDLARAANAHEIITDVVFGNSLDITAVTERYYLDTRGFIRTKTSGLILTDEMKNGTLYKAMSAADRICFIGDSVTEGTKNGGCPWYEPVEEYFKDKEILNYSKGSCTVSYMLEHIDEIPSAELYVIALGTNDVRYRDESKCAMTAESYIERLDELKTKLLSKNDGAEFVFIAPWYSTDGDIYSRLSFADKTAMNEEYSAALEKYCSGNSFMYINANPYIKQILSVSPDREYLLDHIHPNASKGVILYSEAVLMS